MMKDYRERGDTAFKSERCSTKERGGARYTEIEKELLDKPAYFDQITGARSSNASTEENKVEENDSDREEDRGREKNNSV